LATVARQAAEGEALAEASESVRVQLAAFADALEAIGEAAGD